MNVLWQCFLPKLLKKKTKRARRYIIPGGGGYACMHAGAQCLRNMARRLSVPLHRSWGGSTTHCGKISGSISASATREFEAMHHPRPAVAHPAARARPLFTRQAPVSRPSSTASSLPRWLPSRTDPASTAHAVPHAPLAHQPPRPGTIAAPAVAAVPASAATVAPAPVLPRRQRPSVTVVTDASPWVTLLERTGTFATPGSVLNNASTPKTVRYGGDVRVLEPGASTTFQV